MRRALSGDDPKHAHAHIANLRSFFCDDEEEEPHKSLHFRVCVCLIRREKKKMK
jgi:hypothetical protein